MVDTVVSGVCEVIVDIVGDTANLSGAFLLYLAVLTDVVVVALTVDVQTVALSDTVDVVKLIGKIEFLNEGYFVVSDVNHSVCLGCINVIIRSVDSELGCVLGENSVSCGIYPLAIGQFSKTEGKNAVYKALVCGTDSLISGYVCNGVDAVNGSGANTVAVELVPYTLNDVNAGVEGVGERISVLAACSGSSGPAASEIADSDSLDISNGGEGVSVLSKLDVCEIKVTGVTVLLTVAPSACSELESSDMAQICVCFAELVADGVPLSGRKRAFGVGNSVCPALV